MQTFQTSMEHHHQEMLEHLQFFQAVEDHHNNQLDSLSEQLASKKVQMQGEHGQSGYIQGGYGQGGQGGWRQGQGLGQGQGRY